MNRNTLIQDTQVILFQRNFLAIVVLSMLVGNLLLCFAIFFNKKEIVLVPNSISEEISIKNHKMSAGYLEALTRDVINLILNVSPANLEYNSKAILKVIHPRFYGAMKNELNKRNISVENRRVSTIFFPQAINIQNKKNTVQIEGKLSTYVGKQEVEFEQKTYQITYEFSGFMPMIIEFFEVNNDQKKRGEKDEN